MLPFFFHFTYYHRYKWLSQRILSSEFQFSLIKKTIDLQFLQSGFSTLLYITYFKTHELDYSWIFRRDRLSSSQLFVLILPGGNGGALLKRLLFVVFIVSLGHLNISCCYISSIKIKIVQIGCQVVPTRTSKQELLKQAWIFEYDWFKENIKFRVAWVMFVIAVVLVKCFY